MGCVSCEEERKQNSGLKVSKCSLIYLSQALSFALCSLLVSLSLSFLFCLVFSILKTLNFNQHLIFAESPQLL